MRCQLGRLVVPFAYVNEVPFHSGGRGHRWTDQVSSAAFALASFKVAVAGAGTAFTRSKLVWVHRQAHAAACLTPIEARLFEDLVEPFFFGLDFDLPAAWYHHRIDIR